MANALPSRRPSTPLPWGLGVQGTTQQAGCLLDTNQRQAKMMFYINKQTYFEVKFKVLHDF